MDCKAVNMVGLWCLGSVAGMTQLGHKAVSTTLVLWGWELSSELTGMIPLCSSLWRDGHIPPSWLPCWKDLCNLELWAWYFFLLPLDFTRCFHTASGNKTRAPAESRASVWLIRRLCHPWVYVWRDLCQLVHHSMPSIPVTALFTTAEIWNSRGVHQQMDG